MCSYYIKEYFKDWGNLYQVIVAVIFGIISLILWYLDFKKSKQIKAVKEQTKYLKELLYQLVKPNLLVVNQNIMEGIHQFFIITIKNSGDSLYNLIINPIDTKNLNFILPDNVTISKEQIVKLTYNHIKSIPTYNIDGTLKFIFKDELGRDYEQ